MPCLTNIGRRNKMEVKEIHMTKPQSKSEFPVMCMYKNDPSLIVIFHSEKCGMVLRSDSRKTNHPCIYSDDWEPCFGGNWEPVKEKLVFEFEND